MTRHTNRFLLTLSCLFLATQLLSQTTVINETFDDGDLTNNPPWVTFFDTSLISVDSTVSFSPRFSCRIATVNAKSAIETMTKIFGSTQPFQISERVYITSMGDEGIPLLLRGENTVLALFLLPNGVVQLDVLSSTSQWVTKQLRLTQGYALNKWHLFSLEYDGAGTTSLYVDSTYRGQVTQPLVSAPLILQIGNMYNAHTSTFYVDNVTVTTNRIAATPGKIRVVLCSDTGTWDGLSVSVPRVFLRFDLYTSPTGNASRVISPEFRARIRDSYGKPMPFTWCMMDGSTNATNTNPVVHDRWISNLEMMQRYHGDDIRTVGDELSFHYHNWVWCDVNGDGRSYWNQWNTLAGYRQDFLETLGHIVISGGHLPTSFRSGWHYMDNAWEALIDSLIPYRFENASPAYRTTTVEPLDNIYDWSRSPLEWVPYHPSATDYQSPGNLKGWETRCIYMKSATFSQLVGPFTAALGGKDQLLTIWSHLPEADFPEQIIGVDSVLKELHEYFPEVEYEYLTATEAMKQWRGIQDDTPPDLVWNLSRTGDSVFVSIAANEPLYQPAPLVFAKNPANTIVQLIPTLNPKRKWTVGFDISATGFQTLGLAAADTAGNSTVRIIDLTQTAVGFHETERPHRFKLYPSYPNPFNGTTVIRYELQEAGKAELAIFNVMGQLVSVLTDRYQSAGEHSVSWEATGSSTGLYMIRLVSGTQMAITKTLLLK